MEDILKVRVRTEDKEKFEASAVSMGMDLSTWVRFSLLECVARRSEQVAKEDEEIEKLPGSESSKGISGNIRARRRKIREEVLAPPTNLPPAVVEADPMPKPLAKEFWLDYAGRVRTWENRDINARQALGEQAIEAYKKTRAWES